MTKLKPNTMILLFLCCCSFVLIAGNVYVQSSTIHACAHKVTGVLRKVSSPSKCLGSETRISWNTVGPVGPRGLQGIPGPQGPAGPQGPIGPAGSGGGLRIIDSLGKEVGLYQTYLTAVYNPDLNKWLSIRIGTDGFMESGPHIYLYESSDCSGPKRLYSDYGISYLDLAAPTLIEDGVVYYVSGPSESFTYNSFYSADTGCTQETETVDTSPFGTFHISELGFTPPFHLEK